MLNKRSGSIPHAQRTMVNASNAGRDSENSSSVRRSGRIGSRSASSVPKGLQEEGPQAPKPSSQRSVSNLPRVFLLASASNKGPRAQAGPSGTQLTAPMAPQESQELSPDPTGSDPQPVPPAPAEARATVPSPASSIKSGGSSRSFSSATNKQLVKQVRTHFTRRITPKLRKLRSELDDRTAESVQSIKDDVEARPSAQADAILGIVQREASTRVESLLNDAKDDLAAELLATLQMEVPAMLRMSLTTSPPTRCEGRNTENIRLLTQALEQEAARVKILENRLETPLNVRSPGRDQENNLTARDRGRRARRRSGDRRRRDSESTDEDERASHRRFHDGDHRSCSRSSRCPSRDRFRDERRHRRRRGSPCMAATGKARVCMVSRKLHLKTRGSSGYCRTVRTVYVTLTGDEGPVWPTIQGLIPAGWLM